MCSRCIPVSENHSAHILISTHIKFISIFYESIVESDKTLQVMMCVLCQVTAVLTHGEAGLLMQISSIKTIRKKCESSLHFTICQYTYCAC